MLRGIVKKWSASPRIEGEFEKRGGFSFLNRASIAPEEEPAAGENRPLKEIQSPSRFGKDLEEWQNDASANHETIAMTAGEGGSPVSDSPKGQREGPAATASEFEERVITGYWEAPTIRGLKGLRPRKTGSLRLGMIGVQDATEPARDAAAIDPERLSSLAAEIQRCNRELTELLSQLTESAVDSHTCQGPRKLSTDSRSTVTRLFRKSPLEVIRNRVFMPQGVLTVAPAKAMRATISRGRLFFPCPACNQATEVYARVAGQDTRCPNCYSAIRAPHPKKGIKGRNREKDKEALLHPELFMVTVPAPREGAFLSMALFRRLPMVKGFAFLVLLTAVVKICLLSLSGQYIDQPEIDKQAAAGKKVSIHYEGSGELRGRAEETVRGFLRAQSWPEKARFVRNPERVVSRMESYYSAHPEEASPEYISLTSNAPAYAVPGDIDYPLTEVVVQFGNYDLAVFRVEHLPEGDLIEWESSVGYNPVEWGEIVEIGTIKEMETTFRVLAAPDNYYNYRYDSDKYLCVRLQDPGENTLMAYGYIRRDSADAKELDFLLEGSSPENPRRLMVEIKFDRNSMKTHQVQLTRLVQNGWRAEHGIMVSSAQ